MTVTATSSNTALIPNPAVSYISPASTGALTYTPAANASGTATITVLVTDNGGTANGGTNTITQTFTVTVLPVNQPPALTAIATPVAILENAGPQTVNLAGITSGLGNPAENLAIAAVSSNPDLIPNSPRGVAVSYTSPGATGRAHVYPGPLHQRHGGHHRHRDERRRHRQRRLQPDFTQLHRQRHAGQPAAHARPDPEPRSRSSRTASRRKIRGRSSSLESTHGISTGQGDIGQILTITAVSNNTALIPNPSISYTNGSKTALLTYIPTLNASGSAVITVTATDNGGVANGGVNSISQQFTVTILPVNQPPTINPIPNPAPINENNTAVQTINLTGITAGRGNSGEIVTITATSDNPALIPNPITLTATATARSPAAR